MNRSTILQENLQDFRYQSASQILMPASSILIGTGNTLTDAALYSSPIDLTMDLTLGASNLGLDTGTEGSDRFYAVYAVPGANGSYGLRFSTNAPPQAGGTGPTGFTKYRYLGIIRNGGNRYDSGSGFGTGDIARFIKVGKTMWWQHFNSNSGGTYPVAGGTLAGLCVYIANTTTNEVAFNSTNSTNWGMVGNGASGVKLPYRYAMYLWQAGFNANSASVMAFEDSSGNARSYHPAAALSNNTIFIVEAWQAFSRVDNWVSRITLANNNNSNISRFLGTRAMVDPFIVGQG